MHIMQSRRDFLAALSAAGAALVSAALIAVAGSAQAADFPEPKTSEYVIKDFTFHTGEVMPEMKVSYTTVGDPSGEPVLMLHGTTGSAQDMLTEDSPARSTAPVRRSTPRTTSSSSPTRSEPAAAASRPTACGRHSRNTTTTTWWPPSTIW